MSAKITFKKNTWTSYNDIFCQLPENTYMVVPDQFIKEYDIGGLPKIMICDSLDKVISTVKELCKGREEDFTERNFDNVLDYGEYNKYDNIFIDFYGDEYENYQLLIYVFGLSKNDHSLLKENNLIF